jgi:hypothetical protein
VDWNGDGKHDWQDDAIFHNVINTDNNSSNNTPSGGGGNHSSGGSPFCISQLGKAVIVLDIILCVAALFMGYANIIGDLLGFGVIGFFIAQWLDS